MDDDLKIHPEWEKYTPKYSLFGNDIEEGTLGEKLRAVSSGCPFAYLWQ